MLFISSCSGSLLNPFSLLSADLEDDLNTKLLSGHPNPALNLSEVLFICNMRRSTRQTQVLTECFRTYKGVQAPEEISVLYLKEVSGSLNQTKQQISSDVLH